MHTHKHNTRWKKFCPFTQLAELEELIRLKGQPDVSQTEGDMPPYKATTFQVVVRPDGVYTHARTAREWARRKFHRFLANCERPSDFRLANPR